MSAAVNGQKIKISFGIPQRLFDVIQEEAKRLQIPFADAARRGLDYWADQVEQTRHPKERVFVLDKKENRTFPVR